MSPSTATLIALLTLCATLSGCASTADRLGYPAECPKPEQPDDRLKAEPCSYVAITTEMTQVEREATIISNNQCAREIRDRYAELQHWLRGRVE